MLNHQSICQSDRISLWQYGYVEAGNDPLAQVGTYSLMGINRIWGKKISESVPCEWGDGFSQAWIQK